ncbi:MULTISPECIES: hypothetical protein [unclassified Mesorhizobium]|uniref:hypothetical protein n=1 Tax=unclassified Mesorhizobium TaxID=325217 RepID=UPI000FD427B5|nr:MULTISPECIES: hypothetical protein [unclassified Mesorhizobium]TGR84045.1 hypothetical protein EN832_04915 [Mesorhizobium sp. M1C.F.Ca.ET.189.01.1.1]TGS76295.1 hypothetical protein EN819_04915 [Mesorhizobium sp. M1C.F.Ca.ET.176.01.1.1]TGQ75197.1 hypothetical protein EN855_004915 [Mesorhizobium sp. M1C.F.Ca.ET.212.01.1.1]TGR56611.1 hypothetical protein EN838_04915 [Mesorhizobium sp. M1C.F.Ca.ET.195.01.1.1]TGS07249.1 hypothetical protein EN831_04910 [Mesorhizobium sp. M1C.F.Ca.ET.188.01.1.1]
MGDGNPRRLSGFGFRAVLLFGWLSLFSGLDAAIDLRGQNEEEVPKSRNKLDGLLRFIGRDVRMFFHRHAWADSNQALPSEPTLPFLQLEGSASVSHRK